MPSIAIDRTDGLSSATAYKGPCRVATVSNIVLSGEQTVDGVAIVTGDRVLVRAQTTVSENGIWVADTGPWRRAKDFAGSRDVRKGTRAWVTEGDSGPAELEVTTENPIIIGDSSITFELSAGSANAAALSQAVIDAEGWADAAEQYAADAASGANVPIYATKTGMSVLSVPAAVSGLRVNGYAAAGDGADVFYKKAGSEPSHSGKFQSADGAWWELVANYATPEMFGAEGDTTGAASNGTDDTAAIQACFDYIAARGTGWAKLMALKLYRITDTVYARNINVDFDGGVIYYDGTRDRVAVEIGDDADALSVTRKSILNIAVRSTAISWASEDYVGVRFSNFSRGFVSFNIIAGGFTRPWQIYSRNANCAYNTFYGGEFIDGRYQLSITTDGGVVGANEFVNENVFWGGRYGCTSLSNALGSAYGVLFEALNGGYQGQNNNRWYASCFELATGVLGDERTPFYFNDSGGNNYGHDLRWENGRGYFAKAVGTTYAPRKNDFQIGLFSDSGGTLMTPAFLDTGLANGNRVRTEWYNLDVNAAASFDLNQCVSADNATLASVRGGICALTSGSASELRVTGTGITGRKNSIRIGTNRALGFFATCTGGESFVLASETEAGFPGRLAVALYDADGARLTDISAGAPHLIGIGGGSLAWAASYGGIYQLSTDGGLAIFKVSSSVKAIRVHISNGTNAAYAKKLSLSRLGGYDNNRPLHVYSGLGDDSFARKASINPSTGIVGQYGAGDWIENSAGTSGQPMGWKCSVSGRLAAAWVLSTAYVVGQLVLNDTDKIYECVTAGTSAGAGGPTGTGAAIADNTAVWNYLSPLAVFIAGANMP